MTIKELKESPDYLFTGVQLDLFRTLDEYVKKFGSIKKAAKSLRMSRHDLSLFLKGNAPESMRLYDFIGLAILLGYEPVITLKKMEL